MRSPLLLLLCITSACTIPDLSVQSPCLPTPLFDATVPGVHSQQQRLEWWTQRLSHGEEDRVLMNAEAIAALNRKNAQRRTGYQDVLGSAIADLKRVRGDLKERHEWLMKRLRSGRLVEVSKNSFARSWQRSLNAPTTDEIRIVHTEATLRCVPMLDGLFAPPIDIQFDRNRCSGLHPGELIRILRASPDGWLYGHVGHSVGWVRAKYVSPAIEMEEARAFRDDGTRLVVLADRMKVPNGPTLRLGTSVPVVRREAAGWRVRVPSATGLVERLIADTARVREGFLPFTRANLWGLALSQSNRPYGWGGYQGERDCSRLVMDVFAAFGIRLSRHSGFQAKSGQLGVDVSKMSERDKLSALHKSARRGIVLVYMKGHIMILLGQNEGKPYAISSLSEYLRSCDGGPKQVVRVDRIVVSDLELGRGTPRTAFIERLNRLAVFGGGAP